VKRGPVRPSRAAGATWIRLNGAARQVAADALRRQQAIPASRRGGLSRGEASKAGITSGRERAESIARGEWQPAEDLRDFFQRFRGTYLDAVAQGKAWERSKVQQAWDLWGGTPAYVQVMAELGQPPPRLNPKLRQGAGSMRARLQQAAPGESVFMYEATIDDVLADDELLAELEREEPGSQRLVDSYRLAEQAGAEVVADVTLFIEDDGTIAAAFVVMDVRDSPALEERVGMIVWDNRDQPVSQILTRSTRPGVKWQLTHIGRDGEPWGHADLQSVTSAFRQVEARDRMRQVVLKDGTVLVRKGETRLNPRRRRRRVEDYDPAQLLRGTFVELEHTDDPVLAMQIAMDHLDESPRYYVELARMERRLGV